MFFPIRGGFFHVRSSYVLRLFQAKKKPPGGGTSCGESIHSCNSRNISGCRSRRNMMRAFGIPLLRHCDTDGIDTSHSSAMAFVPPNRSIIFDANTIFMVEY